MASLSLQDPYKEVGKQERRSEWSHEIRILLVTAGSERGKGAPQTKEWELLEMERAWKAICRAPVKKKKHGPSGSPTLT